MQIVKVLELTPGDVKAAIREWAKCRVGAEIEKIVFHTRVDAQDAIEVSCEAWLKP